MDRLFLAMLLAVSPLAANALPITINAGEAELLVFDLTGTTASPPFDSLVVALEYTSTDPLNSFDFTMYSNADGTGEVGAFSTALNAPPGPGGGIFNSTDFPSSFLDGIFSWRLEVSLGSVIITDAWAEGTDEEFRTTGRIGPVSDPISSVPEPGSLALFACGLLGWTLARRRRRSSY